jgi:drug/metabolite transporter (DMT)-like permease
VSAGTRPIDRVPSSTRRAAWGYAMVCASYLIMGSIGALVDWATAPEAVLLVIRFVTAGLVLGVVFARRRPLAGIRRPGVPARLLAMGLIDVCTLLLFFIAMREASVAIGMFLCFLAPVWVAVLAPRLFGMRTEPVVYGALALALVGIAIILTPVLAGEGAHASRLGLLAGAVAGLGYAFFQMVVKTLSDRAVGSVTIVLTESVLDSLLLSIALAVWVLATGASYHVTRRDLFVGVVLGVVCTALAYTLWTEGVGRVHVQHASILGYLEPVSAPLYAFLLIGERPGLWTLIGGAVIVVAGVLVVLFGEREQPEELVPL